MSWRGDTHQSPDSAPSHPEETSGSDEDRLPPGHQTSPPEDFVELQLESEGTEESSEESEEQQGRGKEREMEDEEDMELLAELR